VREQSSRRAADIAPMVVVAEMLEAWATRVLSVCGVADRAARTTAESMVHANRRGLDSHGVVLLGVYVPRLRDGIIRGDAEPEVVAGRGAFAMLDGHRSPGAHAGRVAMDWCCERVQSHGLAAAGVRNSSHFGAASFFSELAAARGCIGIALTNSDPGMAPLGARSPILGTNPLAIAAPAANGSITPSLDIATSVVAQGRVLSASRLGSRIPAEWAIGPDGRHTTDPHEALQNSVLPMGGHKGFGLAFMIDVLTACLTGAVISPEVVEEEGVGHLLIALDVEAAGGLEDYGSRLERLIDAVHGAARSQGVPPFLIPGEREHTVAKQRAHAIPIDAPTRSLLDTLSAECEVPPLEGSEVIA
jgi:LDH2 family malate/lactate/ureidoglycolate dehydrogenase